MFSTQYQKHYRANLQLALPIMFGRFSHILITVADNTMVGKHSAIELAAASLANSFGIAVLTFGLGITFALTPLTASASASQNKAACKSFLSHSLVLYPVLGLAMVAAILACSGLLPYFNPDPRIVELAKPYMQILAMTMIPIMIIQVAEQFMEGLSSPHEPMMINLGAALLNIFLNYLLIYGKFGFPEMGLIGAGIATLITRVLAALVMLSLVFILPKFRQYTANLFAEKFDYQVFKTLFLMGAPIGVQMILETAAFGAAGIMTGWVSAETLAAHQIALNIVSITFLVTTGISAAVAVRTAHYLGLGDRQNMRLAGKSAIIMGAGFMTFCGILILIFYEQIPLLYVENLEVHRIAGSLLLLGAAFQVFDGAQVVTLGALRGIGDTTVSAGIAIVAYWLVCLPLGYGLGFYAGLGANGIWYGLLFGLGVASILLFYRFITISKKMKIKEVF